MADKEAHYLGDDGSGAHGGNGDGKASGLLLSASVTSRAYEHRGVLTLMLRQWKGHP